jgi:hypothetical protein
MCAPMLGGSLILWHHLVIGFWKISESNEPLVLGFWTRIRIKITSGSKFLKNKIKLKAQRSDGFCERNRQRANYSR